MEGLLADRLELGEGGKGSIAFCSQFGISVGTAMAVLRSVDWEARTKGAIDAWLVDHPTDVVHRQTVAALVGRVHRDASLENFFCESKRHLTVFNGEGHDRSFYPPNEANLRLKDRIARATLGDC